MDSYLISGGAGFIGSNLAEALLRQGHRVRVLDDFSTGRRQNLSRTEEWASEGGGEFELLEGDLRDPQTCREALRGIQFVFHEAAIPSVQRSVDDPLSTHAVNLNGTLNLLMAAREESVRRFVFASSSSLYGDSETLPKEEAMPPGPISPYGLQKLGAESYCRLFHSLYGLPTVALRYFNVFGPRQDPSSDYAAVIPRFLTAVRDGKRPTIYGDGTQTRDFTYVGNVVDANMRACRADERACGRAFNIACGERISLNELLEQIGTLTGKKVVANYDPPREGDILHSQAAIEQAADYLGYRPSVGLLEGLSRTLEAL